MEILVLLLPVWWETQDAISTILDASLVVCGKNLESGTRCRVSTEADVVLESESLDLGCAVRDFGGLLTENLWGSRCLLIIGRWMASSSELFSLLELIWCWIPFFEIEIGRSFIIAQITGDSQILWARVKNKLDSLCRISDVDLSWKWTVLLYDF